MEIKSEILLPHVYHLSFKTQYELCMSFVRIQEFYESPKFRNKYFTLEQYMDYWCKEFGNGSFTYPSVWEGFNVPGKILMRWWNKCESMEDNLREREEKLLDVTVETMYKEQLDDMRDLNKIYIIASHSEDSKDEKNKTIQHELAHAMYYLYPEYRKKCKELLKNISKEELKDVTKELLEMGYCKEVIEDEMQAYFSTETISLKNDVLGSKVDFVHNFNGFKERKNRVAVNYVRGPANNAYGYG